MNREIKFRGKEIGGDWHYGSLIGSEYAAEIVENAFTPQCVHHAVHPSTVGQFTGIKDCNGKEIYEGDIIIAEEEDICLVKWDMLSTSWVYCDEYSSQENLGEVRGSCFHETDNAEFYEVIGNIYDNPKLLEKE